MRKILFFCFIVAAVAAWCLPPAATARRPLTIDIGSGQAKVSFLKGPVLRASGGGQAWQPLSAKSLLLAGDQVQTGPQAKLEIVLPDASVVRFADNTRFILVRAEGGEAKTRSVKVQVAVGRTWANVTKAVGARGNFELACQNAVAGVRGTVYRMNVEQDKSALVRVYEGQVAVTGKAKEAKPAQGVGRPQKIAGPKSVPGPRKVTPEQWTFIIKSMQQIQIRSDGTTDKPRDFTTKEDRDAWVDWNTERDGVIAVP